MGSVHNDPSKPVKVAVVQAEPAWFDADAATEKTCQLIAEAGTNGAELIAFPELWIPGYPFFLYGHVANVCLDYNLKYYRQSVDLQGKHIERIRIAARSARIHVVIGISERDQGSLYMAQTLIGPDGTILMHRRKMKPTSSERILFGDSSGESTQNVVQTPIGRVGALQCFEHIQPLLKYNTYFQGEQIHIASWPALFPVVGKMPFFNSVDACTMMNHVYAIEGAVFLLLASQVQTEKGLEANGLVAGPDSFTAVVGGGFSQIIAPDGRTLAKSPSPTWEGILYEELDFNEIYYAKNIVDVVGQYSRPDIFSLRVNANVYRQCVYEQPTGTFEHLSRFPKLADSTSIEKETSKHFNDGEK